METRQNAPSFLFVFLSGGLFLVLIFFLAVSQLWQTIHIYTNGIEATAAVVEKWVDRTPRSPNYYVKYTFAVDSNEYTQIEEVEFDVHGRLEIGDPLKIRYLESDPTKSQILSPVSFFKLITTILPIISLLVVIILSIKIAKKFRPGGSGDEQHRGVFHHHP